MITKLAYKMSPPWSTIVARTLLILALPVILLNIVWAMLEVAWACLGEYVSAFESAKGWHR